LGEDCLALGVYRGHRGADHELAFRLQAKHSLVLVPVVPTNVQSTRVHDQDEIHAKVEARPAPLLVARLKQHTSASHAVLQELLIVQLLRTTVNAE